MIMKKIVLSLLVMLFTVQMTFSQSVSWNRRNISMLDGLPTNTVRSITQDRDGFIWMGTDNGLCRYDGYHVLWYRNYQLGTDQFVSALIPFGKNLLVGSSYGAFIFDVQTGHFERLDRSLTALVTSFAVDADGDVWVTTQGQGIFCYQPNTKRTIRYPMKGTKGMLDGVFADNENQVWAISKYDGRVYHFNKARKAFDAVPVSGFPAGIEGMSMAQGADGNVLIGTWGQGVLALGRNGRVKQLVPPVVNGVHLHVHTIYTVAPSTVYIGCEEGLFCYDLQSKNLSPLTGTGNAPTSERFVYAVARDREGGLWMGTYYGGVTYFSPMGERFVSFTPKGSLLQGSVVSRFCEQSGNKIWIATDDGGLNCYDMPSENFVDFPGREALKRMNVHGLWAEGNALWVGTYGNGLVRLNTSTGETKAYMLDGKLKSSNCYAVMRDRQGRLWATSMENVSLYHPVADAFCLVKRLHSLTVDIEEDHSGNLWFATQGAGVWKLSRKGQWKQYLHHADTASPGSNTVNCIREGFGGRLYVATDNGLYEYRPKTDDFRKIAINSKEHCFMGLVLNNDEMWLTAMTEVVKYVPGGRTKVYNRYDGLLAGPFQPNACMMASDGRVWLGSVNGINTFYPYQIKVNNNEPSVFITGFSLPGHEREDMDSLSGILSHTKTIELNASENMFTIQFSALSYVSPAKNRYQYMLKGFDDNWIEAGTEHKAVFTNIPPGSYTFLVRACNNDGVWASLPAKLQIVVHPPFYWSIPAKIFYLLLLGFIIWLLVKRRERKEERRHQRELKAVNEHKEQELREARLHFFTMIAHEIRTPVTLIIGPLEKLKEQFQIKGGYGDGKRLHAEATTQTLDVIDRNAHRLLDLVNQLLDYNKVRQQGMKMHFKLCNISQIMRAVAVRFEPTLSQKGIQFEVCYPEDSFTAVVDGEAVTKMLSNFMTNASKYTKSVIRMGCDKGDDGMFRLRVSDNGIGISLADQKKIFDAFYQAKDNKPGTGIGLHTVKLLAEAHHGKVSVESELGKGSVFTVSLPVKQDVSIAEQDDSLVLVKDDNTIALQNEPTQLDVPTSKKSKPVMLVVDDDDDMRNFIASNFHSSYNVLTANDGNDGLQKLKLADVGVIVSDWMMPNMDGAEFCRRVRQNQDTSHILFIMLTAKTDDESKTEGMNVGADAYIEKPFSMNYLEACIRNLLSRRKLLMEKFANTPSEPISHIANNPVDDALLNKMNAIIEENIDKPELNVNFIASQLHISRSSLFAKIKALTDTTPNEMIQIVRLRRAAQLLREGAYNVSEVAFLVGFNSSSYFTKCFQKQFGVRPSEFK